MGNKIVFVAVTVAGAAAPAHAANFAVITNPPTLLNLFILGVAVACVTATAKVHALVRGGELSKSWQLFMAGFGVLGACELALLADSFELLALPSFVTPLGLMAMAGLFLYGVLEAKRVLS